MVELGEEGKRLKFRSFNSLVQILEFGYEVEENINKTFVSYFFLLNLYIHLFIQAVNQFFRY